MPACRLLTKQMPISAACRPSPCVGRSELPVISPHPDGDPGSVQDLTEFGARTR